MCVFVCGMHDSREERRERRDLTAWCEEGVERGEEGD